MSDRAARREARIRKILENSTSRLKKISTVTDDLPEGTPSSSIDETVPLKHETEIIDNQSIPVIRANNKDEVNLIYENDQRSYRTTEPAAEIPNFLSHTPVRYVLIVLLAIFVRHIILMADYMRNMEFLEYYRLNKIFLPFFTFEIIDFTFFKPFMHQFHYLNVLHLFNLGLRSESISNLIIVAQIFLQLMQDVMVYFFTFVCFGKIIDSIAS